MSEDNSSAAVPDETQQTDDGETNTVAAAVAHARDLVN